MPTSPRLRYEKVSGATVDRLHALVQDEHVRRYLMDGNVFPIDWTRDRIDDSEALFGRRGVGLWLAFEARSDELMGFCGFLLIPSAGGEPQLVYALPGRFTGRGYATEMAKAAIEHAHTHGGFTEIVAGVDEANEASVRVLEKLGFARSATSQGAFGNLFTYRLVL
jgi:RimJ/RimL family protein N-acetyltransferase